jgi:aminotransferase
MPKISSRSANVSWSGIREIFESMQGRKDIVHLELGEPDFQTPQHIIESAKRALDQGHTHYTSSFGIPELREAIADKLRRENGIVVDPRTEVVVTAGASAAVYMSLLVFLEQEDEVLFPDPGWPHTSRCISLVGARPVPYSLREDNDFMPDPQEIQDLITERTRMLVINTPSNPTGAVIDRSTLRAISDIIRGRGVTVLSDEVYERLVYGAAHASFAQLSGDPENCVTVNSLSKTYAMTGWRVGYVVADKESCNQLAKLNLFTNSCPNAVAQKAAVTALKETQEPVSRMVAEYKRRRDFIVKRLNEIRGIKCPNPKGAFYTFPNITALRKSSREVALHLIEDGRVATVPGAAFGKNGEGHLRIAYANSMENLEEATRRIEVSLPNL